jgi:hypothetical protein
MNMDAGVMFRQPAGFSAAGTRGGDASGGSGKVWKTLQRDGNDDDDDDDNDDDDQLDALWEADVAGQAMSGGVPMHMPVPVQVPVQYTYGGRVITGSAFMHHPGPMFLQQCTSPHRRRCVSSVVCGAVLLAGSVT